MDDLTDKYQAFICCNFVSFKQFVYKFHRITGAFGK